MEEKSVDKIKNTSSVVLIIIAVIEAMALIIVAIINMNQSNKFEITFNQYESTVAVLSESINDYQATISNIEASASQEISRINAQHDKDLAKAKTEEHSKGYNEGYEANKSEIETSAELRYIEEYSKGYDKGLTDGKKDNKSPIVTSTTELPKLDEISLFSTVLVRSEHWNTNEGEVEDSLENKYMDVNSYIVSYQDWNSSHSWAEYYINEKYSKLKIKFAAHKDLPRDSVAQMKIYIDKTTDGKWQQVYPDKNIDITRRSELIEKEIDIGQGVKYIKIEVTASHMGYTLLLLDFKLYN